MACTITKLVPNVKCVWKHPKAKEISPRISAGEGDCVWHHGSADSEAVCGIIRAISRKSMACEELATPMVISGHRILLPWQTCKRFNEI